MKRQIKNPLKKINQEQNIKLLVQKRGKKVDTIKAIKHWFPFTGSYEAKKLQTMTKIEVERHKAKARQIYGYNRIV